MNHIRAKLAEWRPLALRGEGGVSRTTMELLRYWRQEGRKHRLFFAQIEAVETIIFLTEARSGFPSRAFVYRSTSRGRMLRRTGSGLFAVTLARWRRARERRPSWACSRPGAFSTRSRRAAMAVISEVVLIVCPNVTIRNRLEELKPQAGEASLYRTRDLVPSHFMPQLARGHVLVTNWHVFEPKTTQVAGQSAKVLRAGREVRTPRETIRIGPRTTTARGHPLPYFSPILKGRWPQA